MRVRSLIYQKIEVKRAIDAMLAPKTGRFLRTTHRFLATRINGYALLKCVAISEMSHIVPNKSLKSIYFTFQNRKRP